MKNKNRIVILNICSTLLLNLISLITAPLFSRLLGTGGYGDLSAFGVWVSVAAIVTTLQTTGTLANARVEFSEEEQPKYQSAAMTLSLLSFFAWAVLVLLFLHPVAGLLEMEPLLVILILVQALGNFGVSFMNQKFTFEMKAGYNILMSVGLSVLNLGLSLLFVLNLPEQSRMYGRVAAQLCSYGVLGILFCLYILLRGRCFVSSKYWKLCLSLSVPLIFYGLTDLLLGHCDLVMLRSMEGSSVSGVYSLAYQMSNVVAMIFGALNTSWMAFFFEYMKQGKREQTLEQTRNYLELFTVLAMGFVLLAPEVFHIFAGEEYWGGIVLIPLFVAGFYLNFLCTFPCNYEYFHKKVKAMSAVTVGSAVVNVVLNYVLIRRIGMAGAAWATLTAHIVQFTIHHFYCKYGVKKGPYLFGANVWGGYAAAFLAAMLLTMFLPEGWLLRWSIGAVLGVWELLQIRKRKALI